MAEHPPGHWPTYFQPAHAPPSAPAVRLPTDVVDLFYLRRTPRDRSTLVAVMRCLGGALDVVAGEALTDVSAELHAQIRTAEINQRQLFRTITAQELYVFGLDAVEQAGQAEGLNDAVFLAGQPQAHIRTTSGQVQITPLEANGRLTVGRLDVLAGFRFGVAATFHHPRSTDEQVVHLLVPSEGLAETRQGRGLVLVYPVLDPATFRSVDNSFVVLRIVYDLLASLQHDIRQVDASHPFAAAVLPVPSRQRLEDDLARDGYMISGDTAIRQSSGAEQAGSFLARLRTWAGLWSEPQIVLPPQATMDQYLAIVDGIVPAVATPADVLMIEAMAAHVTGAALPPEHATKPAITATPAAGVLEPPEPNPASQAYTGETVRLAPTPTEPDPSHSDDWAQDFALPARSSRRQGVRRVAAIPGGPAAATARTIVTSKADWTEDVQAELNASAARTRRQEHEARAAQDAWNNDFTTPAQPPAPPKRSRDEWRDDFD